MSRHVQAYRQTEKRSGDGEPGRKHKDYLKEDEAFNRYLGELWADLRQWLKQDINADDSRVKQRIAHAGQWFGETLIADDALRASLNGHLEQAAHRVAPEFAAFLTRHISDTVKSWDARDMSRQIELNIGKIYSLSASTARWWAGRSGWSYTCYRNFPHCCPHCPLLRRKNG